MLTPVMLTRTINRLLLRTADVTKITMRRPPRPPGGCHAAVQRHALAHRTQFLYVAYSCAYDSDLDASFLEI